MPKNNPKTLQQLKGFKDVLPEHQNYWQFFMAAAENIAHNYCFDRIDLPVLERTQLYVKGTGKHTDIVTKELYSFEDKGGENVTMRPEFTPGICRAYIEHGLLNKPQPVKLYTIGPVFRHDNPQSGRFRQFHQFNLEAMGSDSPVLDSEIIIVCCRLLEQMGIKSVVHINSIGDVDDRAAYVAKLKQYLSSAGRKKELCEDCRERYSKNTLRILDCKNPACQEVLEGAPQIIDFLNDDAKAHFMQTLEYLDDMEVEYHLDVKLVRGLDYYNRTTFEFYPQTNDEEKKSQGALGGGGRYDGLIEIYGGRPTPAIGVAMGIERVISRMRELEIEVPKFHEVDVFVCQLGTEARKESFKLYERLISKGFHVGQNFSKDGLKQQLERADQTKAKLALVLGQKELLDKTIIIRDMNSGIQEIVNYEKIVEELAKRLDPNVINVRSYTIRTKPKNSAEAADTKSNNSKNDSSKENTDDDGHDDQDELDESENLEAINELGEDLPEDKLIVNPEDSYDDVDAL